MSQETGSSTETRSSTEKQGAATSPVLEVRNLSTSFHTRDGVVRAVDNVSLTVYPGEVLGVVGESGCGKSVTSLSIMGLVPKPGRIESGEIMFDGEDLLKLSRKELAELRGKRISMIFQQPQSALNPVHRVGNQIAEVYKIHEGLSKAVGAEHATEALRKVGIPDPSTRSRAYAHEMSGGMAQRVMIAMALALQPELLIADEPTTALDVTIQAQILDLMQGLQRDSGTAVVLITHDLGVIAEMADRVAVMYAGEIVEQSTVQELFDNPKHPYTQGLIGSIPVLGRERETLDTIPGIVPRLVDLGPGCRFADRCAARVDAGLERCHTERPELIEINGSGDTGGAVGPEGTHAVRCWLHSSDAPQSENEGADS